MAASELIGEGEMCPRFCCACNRLRTRINIVRGRYGP